MSRIERGRANPSLDAIETLAVGLKVPVADLFEVQEEAVEDVASILRICARERHEKTDTDRASRGRRGGSVTCGLGEAGNDRVPSLSWSAQRHSGY